MGSKMQIKANILKAHLIVCLFLHIYYIRVMYGMQNANKMHNFEGSLNRMFISISSYSK
jgi:uncharacterized membrane protein YozB (DUF420 family)